MRKKYRIHQIFQRALIDPRIDMHDSAQVTLNVGPVTLDVDPATWASIRQQFDNTAFVSPIETHTVDLSQQDTFTQVGDAVAEATRDAIAARDRHAQRAYAQSEVFRQVYGTPVTRVSDASATGLAEYVRNVFSGLDSTGTTGSVGITSTSVLQGHSNFSQYVDYAANDIRTSLASSAMYERHARDIISNIQESLSEYNPVVHEQLRQEQQSLDGSEHLG